MLVPAGDHPLQIGQLVSPWCYSLNNNSTSVFTHFNYLIEFKMCCLHDRSGESDNGAGSPFYYRHSHLLEPFLVNGITMPACEPCINNGDTPCRFLSDRWIKRNSYQTKTGSGFVFPLPCYHGSLIKVSQAQQRSLRFVRDRQSL